MSTLLATNPTLLDLRARLDPNDQISAVTEILETTNEILLDATFLEGNLLTGHVTTVRTGLPAPTWRKLYGGVQPGKSTSAKITDTCGMLEAYAEVDKALADLNNNAAAFRLSEDKAFLEGMNQEFAQTLFYGNEGTEPEAFTGFMPRFNSLSAENASNVITGGGASTDNTSVLIVCWSPETVHCIYPKGSKVGFQRTDKGQVTIENIDGAGGRAEGYRTHYRWDVGLTVRDWRYVVRIPNISVGALLKTALTGADLVDLIVQGIEMLPNLNMGRTVIYCNRTIKSMLRRQITSAVRNSTLTMENIAGKHVMTLDGIPVRRCDALVNSETVVA